VREAGRHIKPESVEIAGLYWLFGDLVWVFIFTLLYLL
jgi:heme/copper-type cytochrome/quinol oxidase subunit 3